MDASDAQATIEPTADPAATTDSSDGAGGGTANPDGTPPAGGHKKGGVQYLPDKKIGAPAPVAQGVTVRVVRAERVTIKPGLPGDVEGPGLRLTVRVRNSSGQTVDLTGVGVNLTIGRNQPASPSSDANNTSLPAELPSGQSATGTYGFNLPDAEPFQATVHVLYADGRTAAVFRGQID